jgi:hypothetical protein
MSKSTKILLAVAAAAGAFILMQVYLNLSSAAVQLTPEEQQARLKQMVAEVKPSLPMQVHPLVTWFDVKSKNSTIIYKYKIHVPGSQLTGKRAQFESALKDSTAAWLAKFALPANTDIDCELYDEEQRYVYTIKIE